jgi:hypothetical protein
MSSFPFRKLTAVLCVALFVFMSLPSSLPIQPTHAATNSKVLNYLYKISGLKTISGQHNREPNSDPARSTDWISSVTGKYPGLWGGDFLYLADDIQHRGTMIGEAKNSGILARW